MKNSVVVFYTWSGRTKAMADIIARHTGARLVQLQPETPYSQDYDKVLTQAKEEIRRGCHPPLRPVDLDLSEYQVVYVGSPIWWGTVAPPVAAFLSQNNLRGKKVMPFTTHGGGGKGHSDRDVEKLCPGARVAPMYTTYEGGGKGAQEEIAAWIDREG